MSELAGVSVVPTHEYKAHLNEVKDLRVEVRKALELLTASQSKYMTTSEVMEYLKKSENWVLLNKHKLGCSKSAGTLLFKRTDIDEFINQDYFKTK